MPFLDLVFLVLYFNNKQMLVGVLISLGVRRCFSLKFLISWCWEAHHSFSVLNSSGCCNASQEHPLGNYKEWMSSSELGLGASPSSHILGCMCEKGHECTGTHFGGILYFLQPYPTCQRRLLSNSLWSSVCSYSSLSLAIFSLTETDFNSTSDFLSCRLTSSIFALT